ncbi:hypothetical protein Arub01_28490 [Actinomadura rubrobrunea]|jgi:hypothetical protein|uniref:Uncharacterized protein n=1 Tax=Actinomadura rubrobrunea TaxID=115335 RepID=A0A9W6PVH9_9ACTN|nr:hypothetical protein [Actinomadura rubrobrunea]GLW64605.1 hypothetical protein Arub01_28490 [Actinomadura rubrobrunea]
MTDEATQKKRPLITLNTDGQRHPVENALAVSAITIGLIALVLGFIPATHFFGAVAGVIGLPLALYSQLISATTGERWLNVIGMVTSFVGAAFALRHGGFSI